MHNHFIQSRFIAWFFLLLMWLLNEDVKCHMVRWFLQNFEWCLQYLKESIAQHSALLCSAFLLCQCLNKDWIWFTLVSIAFDNKCFEEFSFRSISMFNTINDVCDSIYHNLVSHIHLFVRIHLSCLQHRSSFDSVFRWKWLNIASEQSSRWWIACDIILISWISV